MNYEMLRAYLIGKEESQTDKVILAMTTGYWSGYYQSKKPKPLKALVKKVEKERTYGKPSKTKQEPSEERPDITRFKKLEAKRLRGVQSDG